MRLYPDVPAPRNATIARDAAVVALVLLFAWLGFKVHAAVDELAGLGRGVSDAGTAVQRGFGSAAGAVDDAPVVGGDLAERLREAGRGTGGPVQAAGRRGESSVHSLARLLGWLTFLVPSGLLLGRALPPRMAQVRRLTDATRALAGADAPERRRLLAMRAAFGLPYGALLRHTRDPLGDLEAKRYDALVAAALEDAGLAKAP